MDRVPPRHLRREEADLVRSFGAHIELHTIHHHRTRRGHRNVVLQEIGQRRERDHRSVRLVDRLDVLVGEQRVAHVAEMDSVEAEYAAGDV